ncbi:MAG TPA: LytTR family DNA-binding domain-containing protein [Candidatus Eisenbergiella merdigallinarum]|uniref:Stage 0 sporulation protein A homolog n=1 Tax=Candidatus Eisenbergiella merdigallinarum TaxID=2838552 RepID=A0A9D2MRS6_9FIRM|nr:LytTR family DNA-binding domain-containing protein [Candidatus Eisenbergiella merdigallinarum]
MAPYRLAVCEDDPVEGKQLIKTCDTLLSDRQIPHTLCLFENADSLAKALEQNSDAFDLLLLDIQMEGQSGMALAKELYRRQFPGRFLFITGYAEYALEGYEVHPIHYLLKPVEPSQLEDVLLRDWEEHHRVKNLLLRSGGKTLSLPVADIRYMESRNHTLTVRTAKAEYNLPLSLSEAENLAPPGVFYRCHNSFLVNIRQVEEIERTSLRLRDGTQLPMGRRYYQSFQTAFIHFINQNIQT